MPSRLLKLLAFVMISSSANAALAAPAMFVPPDPGTGWWIRESLLRPASTTVSGVTIDQINTSLVANAGALSAIHVCYVEGLAAGNIIGLTRETQTEIDSTLRENPSAFRRTIEQDGKQFVVQAGIYETCEGEKAAFVMLTQNGKLHSFFPQEARFAWLPDRGKEVVGIASCFLCGDMTELHYDGRRDRFYPEYVGD
jgi:hypothetical protein